MRRHQAAIRNRTHDPRSGGISRIGLSIPHSSIGAVDQLRLSIAVDILQQGNFSLNAGDHFKLVPTTRFAFWIYIQDRAYAPAVTGREDVGPAVTGEVGGELDP